MKRPRRLTAGFAFLAALAVLAVSGCGGDKNSSDTTAKPPPKTNTSAGPTKTEKVPAPQTDTMAPKTGTTSPEKQPGGPGDEEGNRAQALLTGRAGRISPRVVRVPPYIAIRVVLKSADGRRYGLRFGRRRVQAGGQISSASASFAGLRPGKVLVGRPIGAGRPVRIEANAEPGP